MHLATAARDDRQRQAQRLAGRQRAVDDRRRLNVAAQVGDQLEGRGPAPAGCGDRRRDSAAIADRDVIGHGHLEIEQSRWKGQRGIRHRREQNHGAIGEGDHPQAGVMNGNNQRQRNPAHKGKNGSAGRADHRGAGVWSRMSRRIRSVLRPSISAPGDMVRRWRRTGSASSFTSSGITKSRPCRTA